MKTQVETGIANEMDVFKHAAARDPKLINKCEQHTVVSVCSPIFLPMSLLDQSSFLSPDLDMRPGTTRGMIDDVDG